MAKGRKYSESFKQSMIEWLKANEDASYDQSKAHASSLGQETYSKNIHGDLRREAKGPAEAQKERVMNLKTGRFYEKLESAKGGDRIAVYSLKSRGRIQVSIVEEK